MLSLNYENINYVMTQILRLISVSFSYVSISYVLALNLEGKKDKKHSFEKSAHDNKWQVLPNSHK
jgi:hypothetical protein